MVEWTDDELKAAVEAYLTMLDQQEAGQLYSKARVRHALLEGMLSSRSGPSIEYRMRNISAVLELHGRAILAGYLPAVNVGENAAQRIWTIIENADLNGRASPQRSAAVHPRALPASPPPMIFFNIGWMKRYAGDQPDDPTIGGHGYLGLHTHGAEAFNFAPSEDRLLRGYRPPGSREQVRIERLGAGRQDDHVDGVTTVWLAREPGTGRTLIVGWYLNSRVFRHARDGGVDLNEERHGYSVEAQIDEGRLLPVVARSYHVASSRTAKGEGFGQKPTWYGAPTVNARVWAYIRSVEGAAPRAHAPSKGPPKNHDPELRRKVERAAVDHAIGYYKAIYGAECRIVSVEAEAKGWDLEVFNTPEPLLVEVKGLLNASLICELTPNEYAKMMMPSHRRRYVIYVVNNALASAPAVPIPSVFENAGGTTWQTKDGRELVVTERVGALLSCA